LLKGGEIGGRCLGDVSQVAFSLYAATRDSFPINEVPTHIIAHLVEMAEKADQAERSMARLCDLIVNDLDGRGLRPDGDPLPTCKHDQATPDMESKSKTCVACGATVPLTDAEVLIIMTAHRADD